MQHGDDFANEIEKVAGTTNVWYLHKGGYVAFDEWFTGTPTYHDIDQLLEEAGYPDRIDYTFIITGTANIDSPNSLTPSFKPDETPITRGFTMVTERVEDAWNATPDNEDAAVEFCSNLTEVEDMIWSSIKEIAILDKDHWSGGRLRTRHQGI